MMKKASWLEIALATALVGLGTLFTCTPRQALASPMSMLKAMVSGITLHTWGTGDVLRATDLNGNFTALNNGKVGGGVQLVNADVSNSAGIAHSKMATPALLPKAWAHVNATCTAGTCSLGDSSQITSITFSATGVYNVTLSYTPANANFAQIVSSHVANVYCVTTATSTSSPHIIVRCYTDTTGAATNSAFSLLVMDS